MLPRRTVLYDIPVMNIVIRDAVAADLGAIVGLLNAFVSTTTHEYTDTPHTVSSRARGSKTPEQIVFKDQLPHTETGKLLRRFVLKELTESL